MLLSFSSKLGGRVSKNGSNTIAVYKLFHGQWLVLSSLGVHPLGGWAYVNIGLYFHREYGLVLCIFYVKPDG